MQTIIPILGQDVTFTYDIEKGQIGDFNQPDIPDQIIDIEWEQELYPDAVNRCIENDIDFIVAEIWEWLEWEQML